MLLKSGLILFLRQITDYNNIHSPFPACCHASGCCKFCNNLTGGELPMACRPACHIVNEVWGRLNQTNESNKAADASVHR